MWQACRCTAAWLVAMLALASCEGPELTTAGPTPAFDKGGIPRPATIVVEPAEATIAIGDILQLTATAYDHRGVEVGPVTVQWSSGSAAVVSVSRTGRAVGTAQGGPVTVTATYVKKDKYKKKGPAGTAQITVVAPN